MKAYLVFNLPEEQEDFDYANNGLNAACKLDDIWDKVFRPYYKHGYHNKDLNKLLETSDGAAVFRALEAIYKEVISE